MHRQQREILRDNRSYVIDRSVRHGIAGPMTADELARSFNEERIRRKEEAKRYAMNCEEKRIGQTEEEMELLMREYGHVPLSADEIHRIAIDECKEMSMQDFEEISEVLRDRIELQGGIQTEKNNEWLREFVRESKDEQ